MTSAVLVSREIHQNKASNRSMTSELLPQAATSISETVLMCNTASVIDLQSNVLFRDNSSCHWYPDTVEGSNDTDQCGRRIY